MRPKAASLLAVAAVSSLLLAGCSANAPTATEPASAAAETVTVEATNGSIDVPKNPERVVALDNTSFQTLLDWGITPVAAPLPLLPQGFEAWSEADGMIDVGLHREPNLEAINEAKPDLIIGGYRFSEYTEELSRIAPTIDIAGNDEFDGGWLASLRHQTEQLGMIFDRADEAQALVASLDSAVADAAAATNGESVFLSLVSAGKIDNAASRIGRIIEPLNLTDVFGNQETDVHADSGLAPETIAQANPDWAIVLDRDAAVGTEDGSEPVPAKTVFEAQEALAGTTFMQRGQVLYLAPDFYKTEHIQAYTATYEALAQAFQNAE